MSVHYTAALLVAVVTLLALRLFVRGLPTAALGRPISRGAAVVAGVGVAGLVLHCAAMFDRLVVDGLPGAHGDVGLVNAMGAVSVVLYAVPALMVLAGFHRQRWPVLAVLTAALLAVAITMYGHVSVTIHLAVIFVAAVLMSATSSLLITAINHRRHETARANDLDAPKTGRS